MREPNRTSLTSDAPLLLTYGIGLLVRHERDHAARAEATIEFRYRGMNAALRTGNNPLSPIPGLDS